MKRIALIFCIALLAAVAPAQTPDTVFLNIGQESGVLEKQQFIEPYDEIFRTMDPVRWAAKVDFLYGAGRGSAIAFIAGEYKFSPGFGLQLGYGINSVSRYDTFSPVVPNPFFRFYEVANVVGHLVNIQPRWYYQMARRVREGRSANNLSGDYLGLELAHMVYGLGLSAERERFASSETTVALRWGLQRRLFRSGFADVSFGVGARRYDGFDPTEFGERKYWDFFADTRFSLGLGVFRPKASKKDAAYCDVLRCFRDEKKMLKIDLFNLVRVTDKDNIKGTASLAWERKLGESAFSVELSGFVGARKTETTYVNTFDYDYSGWQWGGHIQPRYYYSLKKRMARGKSGNNLSGTYLALQTMFRQENEKQSDVIANQASAFDGTSTYTGAGPMWGFQYRFLKNGFIDLNVGILAGYEIQEGTRNGQDYRSEQNLVDMVGNLRIGLAF